MVNKSYTASFVGYARFVTRAAAVVVAPVAVVAFALASSSASAAVRSAPVVRPTTALLCQATVSNVHPADHTVVYVHVRTVSHAKVTGTAHFKTANSEVRRNANLDGRTTISYSVGSAAPGFTVIVNVTVKSGSAKGTCSAKFTPVT
jgi:hypothetical protein